MLVGRLGDRERLKKRRGRVTEWRRLPRWTLETVQLKREWKEREISGCSRW